MPAAQSGAIKPQQTKHQNNQTHQPTFWLCYMCPTPFWASLFYSLSISLKSEKLHRHRPQIDLPGTNPKCKKISKQERNYISICNHEERQASETRRQRQPRAAQNGDHEGGQAWKTTRQRQPRAAQNGDHEGRQAWDTRRQRRPRAAQNGDHEGRQAWKTRRQPRAAQNGDHKGRQAWDKAAAAATTSPERRSSRATSLGDKAAAAAKSSPEWRSWRETSLEDKAAAKSSPEWRSWDKWRETRQQRQLTRRQRQPRAAQNGDNEGRQMKRFGNSFSNLRQTFPKIFREVIFKRTDVQAEVSISKKFVVLKKSFLK